jgi:uncharacterized protein YijF (DUF1287 family)
MKTERYPKGASEMQALIFLLLGFLTGHSANAQTDFFTRLADSTVTLTKQNVQYDPSYFQLHYPNGDVPSNKGVCTDVIIRAYRKLGIDLQKNVHEDMSENFALYPKIWKMSHTDKNIDHRRVPNLMVFFKRHGTVKSMSTDAKDYLPGDIVCWNLGGGITHIGIIIKRKVPGTDKHFVVHNIGGGQVEEDCLFTYKIIGHYQYSGK